MRVVFVANAAHEIKPDQSTALLIAETARRGVSTWICGVADLEMASSGRVMVHGQPVEAADSPHTSLATAFQAPPEWFQLDSGTVLFLRTNPARDEHRRWAHETMLDLARCARDQGVVVVNDPDGLQRAMSKLYLLEVPVEFRPVTAVLRSPDRIRSFVSRANGPCVLKPLHGTQGRDVFLIRKNERNLGQIIDVLTRGGHAMCQHYVPEARHGDIRLILLNGRPLEAGGRIAAVRRRPAKGEFRSNVQQGGRAVPAEITDRLLAVGAAVGPMLVRDGLFLVGLDVIGGKVVEINVSSTGGLGDAGAFMGVDFVAPILDALEARVRS